MWFLPTLLLLLIFSLPKDLLWGLRVNVLLFALKYVTEEIKQWYLLFAMFSPLLILKSIPR